MSIQSFQRKMRRIPEAVRQATAPATLKGAEEIAQLARHLAPKDQGDLAASIEVTPGGQTTTPYSQPGGAYAVPEGAAVITVGNRDVRYPHLQEYGTTRHAAQPFFWPAYRLLKKRTANRIKRALGQVIRKEWSK
jgi:HK97 gp10 family phage protein